jgi:uridine kinase
MSRPFIIGIAGGSGSGKTTLIKQLRAAFQVKDVCIVCQDDYYKPREEQEVDENGVSNFDLPKSIKRRKLRDDVQRLIDGESIQIEEYVFNNQGAKTGLVEMHPAPIIIVEGLFVFHFSKLASLFDLKVFIHAKETNKIARRITRDAQERNYPLDDVLYRYQHHVTPAYEKYILPYKDQADLVINNNTSFDTGFEVLTAFIRDKLAHKA